MEYNIINLRVFQRDELVELKDSTNQFVIDLSGKDTSDLKHFFDKLFDKIIETKQSITFELGDMVEGELIHNVAKDLIEQINAEIRESEDNFKEIIELASELEISH